MSLREFIRRLGMRRGYLAWRAHRAISLRAADLQAARDQARVSGQPFRQAHGEKPKDIGPRNRAERRSKR